MTTPNPQAGAGRNDARIRPLEGRDRADIARRVADCDDMTHIDLDYGAAVAAIAIESVARAATQPIRYP